MGSMTSPKEKTLNTTKTVSVPFVTNSTAINKGEELIVELSQTQKVIATTKSWRAELKSEEKTANKTKIIQDSFNIPMNWPAVAVVLRFRFNETPQSRRFTRKLRQVASAGTLVMCSV